MSTKFEIVGYFYTGDPEAEPIIDGVCVWEASNYEVACSHDLKHVAWDPKLERFFSVANQKYGTLAMSRAEWIEPDHPELFPIYGKAR